MAEQGYRPEILMTALICGAIAKSVDGIRGRPALREIIKHLADEPPRGESTTPEQVERMETMAHVVLRFYDGLK